MLSSRAQRSLRPLSSYFPAFEKALQRPWTAADPGGNLAMVVAENRLMSARFAERFNATGPPSTSALYYGDFRGHEAFRAALAGFMSKHVTRDAAVEADDLSVGNGCGAVLDTLFHVLAEDGDACLLPAPFYPTFVNDLVARAGVTPLPVHTAAPSMFPTVRDLDEAYAMSNKAGRAPKILLLCNPSNPLGVVFPEGEVRDAILWATGRGMHVISDEIYAASVFDPESTARFASAWDMAAALDDDAAARVHVVYGLSKDLGVSGLRVGAVATRNGTLKEAWGNLGYFNTLPAPSMESLAEMLDDADWTDRFVVDNRAALSASYAALVAALDANDIAHLPGGAAMFAWLDLRQALPASASWEDERRLFDDMCDNGVLLTPGSDCFAAEPGYFRACWAATPPEAHRVVAERVSEVVQRR